MRWGPSFIRRRHGACIFFLAAGIMISLWFAPDAGAQDDVCHRLEAGEIIVTTQGVPGTSLQRGEIMGIIEAPPKIVWQVITDINNFKYFMPRTLNSLAIAADKLPLILQRRPTQADEVEKLLGCNPTDPASYCIPGGKYDVYLYSHLDFPWPAKNRWYIIKLQQDETRAVQHCYHSSWSLVTGNLRENSGEWLLEPFGSTKTKVIYRLCTDPGGAIPKFLVERGTSNTMPQIIEAVRERAAKLCGRKQP
jgi:ribosome-associated toxin RatA of RatAB toxin-antitoxin module